MRRGCFRKASRLLNLPVRQCREARVVNKMVAMHVFPICSLGLVTWFTPELCRCVVYVSHGTRVVEIPSKANTLLLVLFEEPFKSTLTWTHRVHVKLRGHRRIKHQAWAAPSLVLRFPRRLLTCMLRFCRLLMRSRARSCARCLRRSLSCTSPRTIGQP